MKHQWTSKLLLIMLLPALALAKPAVPNLYVYFSKPDPKNFTFGTTYFNGQKGGACTRSNPTSIWTLTYSSPIIGVPANAWDGGNNGVLDWYYYDPSAHFSGPPPAYPAAPNCVPCSVGAIQSASYLGMSNNVAYYSCNFSYLYDTSEINGSTINYNNNTYTFEKCTDYSADNSKIVCTFQADSN